MILPSLLLAIIIACGVAEQGHYLAHWRGQVPREYSNPHKHEGPYVPPTETGVSEP